MVSPTLVDWMPDWKDASQYPGPETTPKQWAWEFLRRNIKYRNLWALITERYIDQSEKIEHAKQLVATRLTDGTMEFLSDDNELSDLCEIANSFSYFFGLISFPPHPSENSPEIEFESFRILTNPENLEQPYKKEIFLSDNEVAVIFDLKLPVKNEIDRAKAFLSEQKHARKITDFRLRIDKYSTYLRILDAKSTYASDNEIMDIIFPHLEKGYPGYNAEDNLEANILAAEELRDRDFRLIGLKGK